MQRLQHVYGHDALNCFTADPTGLKVGSVHNDKRDVILHDRLCEAAITLNPGIPEAAIDEALKQLGDKRRARYRSPRPSLSDEGTLLIDGDEPGVALGKFAVAHGDVALVLEPVAVAQGQARHIQQRQIPEVTL